MDSQFEPEEDHNNYVDSDNVTLNGFCFCARHGLELCAKCSTDNRPTNNIMVEDILQNNLSEAELESKWKGDDREPFSVTKQWTRVSGKPKCMAHKEIGCKECFDWSAKILADLQGGRRAKKAAHRRRSKES